MAYTPDIDINKVGKRMKEKQKQKAKNEMSSENPHSGQEYTKHHGEKALF